MRIKFLIYIIFLFSLSALSQNDEIFKMKKAETGSFRIDKKYDFDTRIDLSNQKTLTSLAVSGKIKLIDNKSLVRVVLATKEHEYLVYEAYPLIVDKLNFSIEKVCEETSLINNEKPVELIVIVRNAEFELKQIHVSNSDLSDNEKLGLAKMKHGFKKQIEKHKSTTINYNNSKEQKTWLADSTKLSTLPFEKKKNLFGGNYDFMTEGYEYYSDGIFSFGSLPTTETTVQSATVGSPPSEFDWRNRHGQNWMTTTRLQGYVCGACAAFAGVAVLEIMTNLYYNRHLNLDLSEQQVLSCGPVSCSVGGSVNNVLDYMKNNPVCNESCFHYTATKEPCLNRCPSPSEEIGFPRYIDPFSAAGTVSSDVLMKALIFKGPIATGIVVADVKHAMALIGYKVIQQGDTIKRVISGSWVDVIIQPDDKIIGSTYWIFKDSYTGAHNGYAYLYFNIIGECLKWPNGVICYNIITPITSLNYSESNRLCVDNDDDGYYNWGIGPKPNTCPSCSSGEEDGNDSNPTIGPLDVNGNCIPITSPLVYNQHIVNTTETWQGHYSECGNVFVTNGGNLTLN